MTRNETEEGCLDWWEMRGALTALAGRCAADWPEIAAQLESLALRVEMQHDADEEAASIERGIERDIERGERGVEGDEDAE